MISVPCHHNQKYSQSTTLKSGRRKSVCHGHDNSIKKSSLGQRTSQCLKNVSRLQFLCSMRSIRYVFSPFWTGSWGFLKLAHHQSCCCHITKPVAQPSQSKQVNFINAAIFNSDSGMTEKFSARKIFCKQPLPHPLQRAILSTRGLASRLGLASLQWCYQLSDVKNEPVVALLRVKSPRGPYSCMYVTSPEVVLLQVKSPRGPYSRMYVTSPVVTLLQARSPLELYLCV